MDKKEETRPKTITEKASEMFAYLHIDKKMGIEAVHKLNMEMDKSQKPMALLGNRAVEYFKGKMGDKHTPILLSVYCLIFNRILFDPSIGVITMTEDKGHTDRIIKP